MKLGKVILFEGFNSHSLPEFIKDAVEKITLLYLQCQSLEDASLKVTIDEFKDALNEVSFRNILTELSKYKVRMTNLGINLGRITSDQLAKMIIDTKKSLYSEFKSRYNATASSRRVYRDEARNPEQYSAPSMEVLNGRFNGRLGKDLINAATKKLVTTIIDEIIRDSDNMYITDNGGYDDWIRRYARLNGLSIREIKQLVTNYIDRDQIIAEVRAWRWWDQAGIDRDEIPLFVNYYTYAKACNDIFAMLKGYVDIYHFRKR